MFSAKVHANRCFLPNLSRRAMLQHCSTGFGLTALSAILQGRSLRGDDLPSNAALRKLHHAAKAKHVIFCFMSGGVSHVDSFDPKPRLERDHGKPMPFPIERTQFNNNGSIMASPFKFTPAGTSGIPVSSMFPNIARVADEMAVIRSMTSPVNEHAQGNFFVHTGFPVMGYPSAGAWATYGLGTEDQDLPGYIVLQSGSAVPPHGGVSLFSNGFLPAQNQGSILNVDREDPIRNIRPADMGPIQRRRLSLMKNLDQTFLESTGNDQQVDAAIENF
jgi:hypothetical protein